MKSLSNKETIVLQAARDGMRNYEIAKMLGLSLKTIENHMRACIIKLGANNRTHAVVKAIREEIISL